MVIPQSDVPDLYFSHTVPAMGIGQKIRAVHIFKENV